MISDLSCCMVLGSTGPQSKGAVIAVSLSTSHFKLFCFQVELASTSAVLQEAEEMFLQDQE